jgi:hypothetical protein
LTYFAEALRVVVARFITPSVTGIFVEDSEQDSVVEGNGKHKKHKRGSSRKGENTSSVPAVVKFKFFLLFSNHDGSWFEREVLRNAQQRN